MTSRSAPFAALLVVSLGAAGTAHAQAPLELSVEGALERALAGSEEVLVAGAVVGRADAERIRARADLLPQLAGTASYERTLESEFEGLFDGGGGAMLPMGFSNLPFGRENVWRYGLTASQTLFAGGRVVARNRAARAARAAAGAGLESARAQAVLDAAQAYYDTVLADRLVQIATNSAALAEKTLEHARVGRKVGTVPEFDVLRAEVTLENARAEVVLRGTERTLAVERLRTLLDLPQDRPLVLTTELAPEPAPVVARARQVAGVREAAPTHPAVVRQAEEAVAIRTQGVAIARAARFPQLTLLSNLGRVAYPSGFGPEDWRTNWTLGAFLTVPIFTGGRLHGDALAAQADLAEARARVRQVRELAALHERLAHEQSRAARAILAAQSATLGQARRAVEIAEVRYREGVSTQLELNDARLAHDRAQANAARAARDVQVAEVRIGLLPALPVAAAALSGAATTPSSPTNAAAGAEAASRGAAR